jgi:hypothetical protein
MKIEQTKEAIKIMQAFVDGKEVIARPVGFERWDTPISPKWNWEDFEYRIKTTQTFRPWTADEVPLGCWFRAHQGNNRYKWKPVTIQPLGAITVPADIGHSLKLHTFLEFLSIDCEHSIDKGVTWHPCGVMEESK